ncbi:hypothetical protein GCM10007854_12760 [Algimonas porphyrae]|uniref:Uncharacterized protein n=1 Tax=Algimonas porphyrae TaxID=1128113 RepID=A0ABQ5UYG8_9PROT|nr:hypothetical protein GCM10007854_12760 [Algimonas porphyrae]
MFARLHLTQDAFILQLFLQRAKGLIDIVLADVDFDHVSVQLSFMFDTMQCIEGVVSIAKGPGLPAEPAFGRGHSGDSPSPQGIFAVGRWREYAIVAP